MTQPPEVPCGKSDDLPWNQVADIEVNQAAPALHIHIPRTAGVSMYAAMKESGQSYAFCTGRIDRFHRDATFATFGHSNPFLLMRHGLLDEIEITKRFVFCFVRNPWDRLVSLYANILKLAGQNFEIRYRGELGNDKVRGFATRCVPWGTANPDCLQSFGQFVLAAVKAPPVGYGTMPALAWARPQLEWCRHYGRDIVDFYGRFEDLEVGWQVVCEAVRCQMPLGYINGIKRSKRYQDYYNPATRKMVADRYAEEIEVFKYRF